MKTKYPADGIRWREVASTNVARVGWDRGRRLYVRFHSGTLYLYENVSRQRAVACARANSVGGYLAREIKPNFPAVKVS